MDGNLPPAPTPPVGGSGSVDLLNLLKFNGKGPQSIHQLHGPSSLSHQYDHQNEHQQRYPSQPQAQTQLQPQPQSPQQSKSQPVEPQMFPITTVASANARIMAPAPVAPDPTGMLAAMMRGETKNHRNGITSPTPPASSVFNSSPPPDTRAYLLNLLNRPKPGQQDDQQQQQIHPANDSQSQGHHSGIPTPQSQSQQQQQSQSQGHHEISGSPNSVSRFPIQNSISPVAQNSNSSIPPGYKFDHPAHEQHIPNYGNGNNNNNNGSANAANNPYYGSDPGAHSNPSHVYGYPGGPGSIHSFTSRDIRDDSPAGSASGSRHVDQTPDRDGHASSATSFQILKKPMSDSQSPQNSMDFVRPGSGTLPIASPSHENRQRDQNVDQTQTPHTNTTESFISITPINQGYHDGFFDNLPKGVTALERPVVAIHDSASGVSKPESAASPVHHDMLNSLVEPKPQNMPPQSPVKSSIPMGDRAIAAAPVCVPTTVNQTDGSKENWIPPQTSKTDDIAHISDDDEGSNTASKSGTEDEAAIPGSSDEAVAENWENADPEEDESAATSAEKEEPLVKVYNFPMQPWISITLHEKTEPRPYFRDSAVMEIARLKKDFDQVDRNLYTATSRYMAYGMSKAGGLRVIRQDDGKDAKIFADTKDRIFNVSMSVTGSDDATSKQEVILGTGIGGTVYWAKIWQDDKDLVSGEDHPELNGFALPPISAQEGDAPGGLLKTRARVSSGHPEYFATGRGKYISIIWPSVIMQGDYFKPGYDRVVDSEKLSRDCSLKINTGKAGKDFVFSQDDTVVVSLDKSGRIRFWDIRELVAVREGSDPSAPMPANTHMEITEPLLTLASTPEGEKAWPTSVLLLDKARPFQKRCALRYMIVGMKQNHTLQLWDLALGKPVQEFNLPHSKESDAVCSVIYHPATGMLVIGHPTRNSIYLAHLSAPKYSFKSISQAVYMSRLAAGDSTIPQPDSTAVISGVREYSFGNRGILRSLDILTNPASSPEEKDQTLFELYAMHSKGVTCIFMKQADLGWSKENKVISAINAESAGVITVDKLKTIAPLPSEETRPPFSTARKEVSAQGVEDTNHKPSAAASDPPKFRIETKERDTNDGNLTGNEKNERKLRKKKNSPQGEVTLLSNNFAGKAAVKNESAAKAGGLQKGSLNVSQDAIEHAVKGMEQRLSHNLSDLMVSSIKNLNSVVDDTIRSRDTEFDHRQIKLLDLVSEVLNGNTQKVLGKIIDEQFHESIVPAINQATTNAINSQLSNKLSSHVSSVVQKELQRIIPGVIQQCLHSSLQNPQFVDVLSSKVSNMVTMRVQECQDDFLSNLGPNLAPSFTAMNIQATERVAAEMHERYQDEIDKLNSYRASDRNKIEQLLSLVTRLSDTVSTMAQSQGQFQNEILKLQQRQARDTRFTSASHGNDSPHAMDHSPRGAPSHNMHASPQSSIEHQHQQQQQQLLLHQQSLSQPQMQHQLQQQVPVQSQPQHMYKASQSQLVAQPQQQVSLSNQGSQKQQPRQLGGGVSGNSNNNGELANEYDETLNSNIMAVQSLVNEDKLEAAIVRWLQGGREQEVFAHFWCQLNPAILQNVPPLVQLSVAATVAQNLEPGPLLRAKTAWLDMCVLYLYNNLPTFDAQIKEVTPRIMNLVLASSNKLINRLGGPGSIDPLVPILTTTLSRSRRILDMLNQEVQY
ncbi:hypothetical protein Cpir12675_003230 [Ceratocystis pirilliformis]|uniref:EDC4-like protein pdc1 beta-propeller domain-containing protein n=1 Tax=Ceratocystis pirilliformis TaxID=259994 RepID=A0ABR3Z4X1_9PEZI